MGLFSFVSDTVNAWNHYTDVARENALRRAKTDLKIEKSRVKLTDANVKAIEAETSLIRARAGLLEAKSGGNKDVNTVNSQGCGDHQGDPGRDSRRQKEASAG